MARPSSGQAGDSKAVHPGEPTHVCICSNTSRVPRPRNAFILYRQHHHSLVVAENPGKTNPEISKIIGEQWRSLPQREKDFWIQLGDEEKKSHLERFPDYRYQPRRSSKRGSNYSDSGICPVCKGITPAALQQMNQQQQSTPGTPQPSQAGPSQQPQPQPQQQQHHQQHQQQQHQQHQQQPLPPPPPPPQQQTGQQHGQPQPSQPGQPGQQQAPRVQQTQIPPVQSVQQGQGQPPQHGLPNPVTTSTNYTPYASPVAAHAHFDYYRSHGPPLQRSSHPGTTGYFPPPNQYYGPPQSAPGSLPSTPRPSSMFDDPTPKSSIGSMSLRHFSGASGTSFSSVSSRSGSLMSRSSLSSVSSEGAFPPTLLPRIVPRPQDELPAPGGTPSGSASGPSSGAPGGPPPPAQQPSQVTSQQFQQQQAQQPQAPQPAMAGQQAHPQPPSTPPIADLKKGSIAHSPTQPNWSHQHPSQHTQPAPPPAQGQHPALHQQQQQQLHHHHHHHPMPGPLSSVIEEEARLKKRRMSSHYDPKSPHPGRRDRYQSAIALVTSASSPPPSEVTVREKADILSTICEPVSHKKGSIIAIEGKDIDMIRRITQLLSERLREEQKTCNYDGLFCSDWVNQPPAHLTHPTALNMWRVSCLYQIVASLLQKSADYTVIGGYAMAVADELADQESVAAKPGQNARETSTDVDVNMEQAPSEGTNNDSNNDPEIKSEPPRSPTMSGSAFVDADDVSYRHRWTSSVNVLRGLPGPDYMVYVQSEGLTQSEVAVAELKNGMKMLVIGGNKDMGDRIVSKILDVVNKPQ